MTCQSCGESCAEPVRGAAISSADRIAVTIRCAQCDHTWTEEAEQPLLIRKPDRRRQP